MLRLALIRFGLFLILLVPAACRCRSAPEPQTPPSPPPVKAETPAQEPQDPQEMEGDSEPAPTPEMQKAFSDAVTEMKEELKYGFHVDGRFPFVVGADLPPQRIKRFLDHTIFASYEAFYIQFFKVRPDKVIRVYLFDGKDSYRKHTWRLWQDRPDTPYGYYMASRRALIMNIATGGGTLIHEMVHALMAYDFDHAPTWFDEGMASLFEQCSIRYKRILGLENWRLPILKKGIRQKRILPLRALMATSRDEFLDDESSLHYAQARYFCMYMQQEGILEKFYRNYHRDFEKDPTGVATAEALFEKSLEAVQKDWLKWVATLRWRGR
jgi:hypothetical protein